MSEYIEQLQESAKNHPAEKAAVTPDVEVDPKSQSSSDLPYHTAETEQIAKERAE